MKLWLKQNRQKILASLLAILIGLAAYTSIIDEILKKTIVHRFDQKGEQYLDQTMKHALYTFALVRGINGVISVIQGTDLSVSPAGIGLSLSLGEILDPINDLIERFSWVMLVSVSSLGIQKVLMEMANWLGLNILLAGSMLMIFIGIWRPQFFKFNLINSGYKLIIIAFIIRFAIPASALAGSKIYDLFLHDKYTNSIESLNKIDQHIKNTRLMEDQDKETSGYLDKLKELYKSAGEYKKFKDKILFLKNQISDYAQYTVNLIIVFIIQTIIIPIIFLWTLRHVTKIIY